MIISKPVRKTAIEYRDRSGEGANYRLKFGAQEEDKNHNALYMKKRYVGQRRRVEIDENLIEVLDYAPQTAPKKVFMEPPKEAKEKPHRPNRKKVSIKYRTDYLRSKMV